MKNAVTVDERQQPVVEPAGEGETEAGQPGRREGLLTAGGHCADKPLAGTGAG